ncbi:MAG: DUF2147 domain-containing protein [Prevotella sp.]|jgi:uncharacterized protein (DUF2147 family)|uniref:DUF2147 domain-containing protein n=1 Tax=Dysgonomonas gadei ATCC BAA-286 TaxID=742766 RepID=F5IT05_9BACT|nr:MULTISPECIES: DUF2147 domain-containing protein [Dysgonomonas]EGK01182.1 hypothetical protein HMPREF9455_00222 [Dysgonomonas gadei ATCC BAA-286]MBF0647750.1 DUF2147 domain-containing protein [Dysgonomonas sp. GY75]MDR1505371.1 DUF2147 domain-containing protein [Prevotella sp.]
MKLKFILLAGLFISILSANAQSVTGKWKTFDDETKEAKSIVEITERDGKIYGKVIEILNPAKKNIKCTNCSGADKDKPVLGLEILKGLSKDGKEYSDGKILDPSNGKLYKCIVSLDGNDKLKVRGYVGISAFGRTQNWVRVK